MFYLIFGNDQLLSITTRRFVPYIPFTKTNVSLSIISSFAHLFWSQTKSTRVAQLVKCNDIYLQKKSCLINMNFRCSTIFKFLYFGRQMHVYIICSLIRKFSCKKYVTSHVKDLQNSLMHAIPFIIPFIVSLAPLISGTMTMTI